MSGHVGACDPHGSAYVKRRTPPRRVFSGVTLLAVVRARFSLPAFLFAFACVACARDEIGVDAHDHEGAWARFATTGRHITAPLDVGDGVVVGITTRGAGAFVDERGAIVGTLDGAIDGAIDGGSSDATCVLVRLDDDGALLWQTPVRADDAQTRCIDVRFEANHRDDRDEDGRNTIVVRGETFDVDESHVRVSARDVSTTLGDDDTWTLTLDEDGLARELDAALRMDTCTPTLAALSTAMDDALEAVRFGSPDGYVEARGVAGDVGALLVPQGAALDAIVPGATAPAVDPSAVESVATVVSLRPRRE